MSAINESNGAGALQNGVEQLLDEYMQGLCAGDAQSASLAIDRALSSGLSPARAYLKILIPAQRSFSTRCEEGQQSVAEEHLAYQIHLNEMSRLRNLFRPTSKLGVRAVVATVDGDSHFTGCRAAADLLLLDGWEVDFLGPNTPAGELVNFIAQRGFDLVALGSKVDANISELKKAIVALRKLPKPPKIMLGGPAIERASSAVLADLAPDEVAYDYKQVVEKARKLCGMLDSQASISQYLKGMGARILETRKIRRMSQQDLADTSGLDRAYISSVENGKQNITLGAVFKLAEALDISMEDLLVDAGKLRKP